MLIVTSRLLADFGAQDRLRGSLDYRPLRFVEDGAAPASQAFWAEQSQTRVRWLPLSYWTVEPIAGNYINVSEQGLRPTVSNGAAADSPLPRPEQLNWCLVSTAGPAAADSVIQSATDRHRKPGIGAKRP